MLILLTSWYAIIAQASSFEDARAFAFCTLVHLHAHKLHKLSTHKEEEKTHQH
jgi:hypothetical protein